MLPTDDRSLVIKLKDGDTNAFEALYGKYSARLYNSVLLIARDHNLAKDIVQTSFLTVWEKRDLLNPEKGFSAYLFIIARNFVYKESKRLILNDKFSRQSQSVNELFEDETIDRLHTEYLQEQIETLVGKLDDTPRKIFRLKKEGDKSNREIAEELGITERAVEAHFYRTLKYLKEKFRDKMVSFFL